MVQQQDIDDAEITKPHEHDQQHDDVRILLLGDPGVGKTSLIYTLVNDKYVTNVPPKMADVIIPPEITPDRVSINISDFNENEQTYDELKDAVEDANVILCVYIAGDSDSLDKVASYWIPTIRKYQTTSVTYKPVILVANKADLMKEEKSLDRVSSLMQNFVEIEAFIEVSALTQKNLAECFFTAQKAVTYPLAPLFDPQLRALTKKCQNALNDIFNLCDLDGDGFLSDHELNLFQETCFGTPLQKDALDDLKNIVYNTISGGVSHEGLSLAGFLFLHTLALDRGQHVDFTWKVLRRFGYFDNELNNSGNINLAESMRGDLSGSHRGLDDSSSRISNGDGDFDEVSQVSDDFGQLDLSWIREHSKIIKLGFGLTLATLISMLAFRYLVRDGARGSI